MKWETLNFKNILTFGSVEWQSFILGMIIIAIILMVEIVLFNAGII